MWRACQGPSRARPALLCCGSHTVRGPRTPPTPNPNGNACCNPASAQDKGAGDGAARQLASRAAVAEVWPLVEPHLLDDLQRITRYRGFLLAAAAQFPAPPPSLVQRSAAAWRQLMAVEPPMLPCAELDGAAGSSAAAADPMQRLLQLAAARGGSKEQAAVAQAPEPMAVDGEAEGGADAAVAEEAAGQGGLSEEDGERYAPVIRSLFYLLSVLQDAEVILGLGCGPGG